MARIFEMKIARSAAAALLMATELALSLGARAQVPAPAAGPLQSGNETGAAAPAGTAWTLPMLVEELKKSNPQLRATQGLAAAAQYGVQPVAAPDNPTFTVTQSPVPNNPFAVGASQGMTWSISQNLYWPGKKRLAGEIAQTQADAAKLQIEAVQVQLVGQLKTAWFGWQQNEAQLRLLSAQLERLEQIKQVTQTRYAHNAAAYADFINAQVNQAQVRTQILGLQAQNKALAGQINGLVGRAPQAPLTLATEEVAVAQEAPSLDAFRQQALEHNPQLKVSQRSIEGAQRSVELAELGSRPDFNVALLFNSAAPPWGFANNDSYGISLGVTFPLWYSKRERNLIDQAKAQLSAVQDVDQSVQQQTLYAVETAYYQWLQSVAQVKLVEERIVEQSRVAYRLSLSNYGTGQVGFVDLMNAYTAMNNAEALNVQTRTAAVQARIALDVAVGNL
jgi:outer membrane protein TolC